MFHYQHYITIRKLSSFCPVHCDAQLQIVYPRNKEIVVTYDTEQYTLSPGEAILILPYHLCGFSYSSDMDCIILVFPREVTAHFTDCYKNRCAQEVFSLDPAVIQYIDYLIDNFEKNSNDFTDHAIFNAFAHQYIQSHTQSNIKTPVPDFIPRVIEYINDHIENDIFLADIARATGINSRQLSKYFVETFGIKLCDFITNARTQRAIVLLNTTSLSITEISELCGFGSLRNFNRCFKNKVGFSPREFRKNL